MHIYSFLEHFLSACYVPGAKIGIGSIKKDIHSPSIQYVYSLVGGNVFKNGLKCHRP